MNEQEEKLQKKRLRTKERKARFMARQSKESLDKIRAQDSEYRRHRVNQMTPEELNVHRRYNAKIHREHIDLMTPEELNARRSSNAASQQRRLANMTANKLQTHRLTNAESQSLARKRAREAFNNEAINFNESQAIHHDCGAFDILCTFCGSKNFSDELPVDKMFTSCCRKGKVKLPQHLDSNGSPLEYPLFLKSLLSDTNNPDREHFRENIRAYNSALSFASMGAKIVDLPGRGPYVFKIHGTTYHRTSHLQTFDGQSPQFAQLYVLDSTEATEVRQGHASNQNCRTDIFDKIDRFFRTNNRLAQSYQLIRDVEAQELKRASEAGEHIPVVSMILKKDRRSDQRRYNAPTSNEVAMVFVNADGEPPFNRDIHIYLINVENPDQKFININILSPNLDPMTYSIIFPFGEPGWQPNWQCPSYEGITGNPIRKNISMLQYKAALTAIRGDFNPVMNSGKLTQQWLVDSYLQIEANNLNYIRQNQKRLRAEQYKGLADHVSNMIHKNCTAAGIPVILPSSFEGSPRNMRERCCDAMSLFAK
ncbi:hypothetical protein RF11_10812 [Thelohanellus kitauei]|uniref:Helitron helicase-like domain-containing protein n=1 Tax=Thelohanellus kitauei TaxID=669202 RepID=A0A0C2ISP1_THEKT|nr:hypothetical protein RF11_10812 [Thelohanellus kitauei]